MPYKKTSRAIKASKAVMSSPTYDTDGKDSSAADLTKAAFEHVTNVNDAVPSGTLRSMFQKRSKAINKSLKG